MQITVVISISDDEIKKIAESTRVPMRLLKPEQLQIQWGYADPEHGTPIRPLGYITWHRDGEFRQIPDNLPKSIAVEVVRLLNEKGPELVP